MKLPETLDSRTHGSGCVHACPAAATDVLGVLIAAAARVIGYC